MATESFNQVCDGKKQGVWREPAEAGFWHGYYQDDLKAGTWILWEASMVRKLVNYQHGYKEGVAYQFRTDGSLHYSLTFAHDRVHGRANFYASDGQQIAAYDYVNDKLDQVALYRVHQESPPKAATYLPDF